MSFDFLLDEAVELQVRNRLQNASYEALHVEEISGLGKGADDGAVLDYARSEQFVLVTYDDDFQDLASPRDAVLRFSDASWSAKEVADTLIRIDDLFTGDEISGELIVGRDWL